ncbi:MAG TPA: isoprenylcysteine carboxylmethyltransferase family protein [Gemmatimonadaceae bacterium]
MAHPAPLPHAGVRFPPPLVYVVGLAAGWLLNRWWPAPITAGPSGLRVALGALGVLAWLAIFLGAFAAFRRSRTTIVPNRPATVIVTGGPYRFTRNPMYVSLVALYLGLTLLLNTWWPLLFLPVVVVVIQARVIAREERYLQSAFPAEYGAYAGRVRRWL